MFHLAGYTLLIGNTADTDVPAVADDILTVQNNHFVLSQPMLLLGAAAMSATISRAKLASPSMRQIASPFIRPIIAAATPGTNPNIWILDWNPFQVRPFEEIQMQGTSGVAMTERFTGLIWLADAITPLPFGNVIPLRVTSTTAAVANAWTSVTLTFNDTIPSGVYTAVFSEMQSANGIAHRWIFSNQTWRPGYLSFSALSQRAPYALSKGQFGVMGRFRSNDLPRCQVLANAADAAHEGYLHVVRTGDLS